MSDAAGRPRLLIIDDEPLVCELMSDIARSAGFDPVGASAAEDIATYTRVNHEVVVLDLHLGEINALDVLARIAETSVRTKLVLISGSHDAVNDDASSWARTHGLAVVADLAKPVDVRVIRSLLKGLAETSAISQFGDADERSSVG